MKYFYRHFRIGCMILINAMIDPHRDILLKIENDIAQSINYGEKNTQNKVDKTKKRMKMYKMK